MVVSDDLAALELRGGHPALDFVNTLEGARGGPPGTDHLRDYADVVGWAVRAELLDEGPARSLLRRAQAHPHAAAAAYGRARALRAATASVFDALAAGRPAPRRDLAHLC